MAGEGLVEEVGFEEWSDLESRTSAFRGEKAQGQRSLRRETRKWAGARI